VADERLYVLKGGKVFHTAVEQAANHGAVAGPEDWALVDLRVQSALVTTDAKLGIARYVTVCNQTPICLPANADYCTLLLTERRHLFNEDT
jgi:hypothetical protein